MSTPSFVTPAEAWNDLRAAPWWRRWIDWVDFWLVDHGFVRAIYNNRFRRPGGFFRSSQVSASQLRALVNHARLRTLVNLRGRNERSGFYRIEVEWAERLGVRMVNMKLLSRGLLPAHEILEVKAFIDSMELPGVAHCKSGADRAGLFAALYRHFRLGEPIERVKEELSWRYGHFSQAQTGVLDYFFDCYLQERKPHQSFLNWVIHDYNMERVRAQFKPQGWASWLVDTILRRE